MADSQNRRNSSSSSNKINSATTKSAKATRLIASAAATPDEVLRLLETCQLSEQDADDLLKDAYALNRLLRAHLAHVESPHGRNSSHPRRHDDQSEEAASPDDGTLPGNAHDDANISGSKGFGRQQLSGPEIRQQSSSRRSVSLSGRSSVSLASAGSWQEQAPRLPPIRKSYPPQRLSDMARVYSSGVIQPGHRAGSGSSAASATAAAAAATTSSAKKRL